MDASMATYPPPPCGYYTSPLPFSYNAPSAATLPYPPSASAFSPPPSFFWSPTAYQSTPSSAQSWVASAPSPALDSCIQRQVDLSAACAPVTSAEYSIATAAEDLSFSLPVDTQPPHPSPVGNTTTNHVHQASKDTMLFQASVPSFFESSEAQARAEATIREQMPRAVLDLKRRLDAQLVRDRTSFDTIKGELAKLTSMAAQLADSIGKQSSAAASSSASYLSPPVYATSASSMPSNTAYVAQQVFGELPTPSLLQGTHGSAPNYCSGHHNPIQHSCVSSLSEQNLDERSQQYDFSNLSRKTVFRADGTEHHYYVLPETYPLVRATPQQVFDVCDEETKDCSNEFHDVFTSSPEQLALSFHKAPENASSEQLKGFSSAPETEHTSACLSIISDVRDLPLELQQQDDKKACNCPVLKASDSVITSSNQLGSEHSMRELRMLWDLGASAIPVNPLNNDNNNDTIGMFNEAVLHIPPAKPPERYVSADSSPVNVQLKTPPLNVLVTRERREQWRIHETIQVLVQD